MGTLLVVAATLWLTVYWSGRGTLASDTVTLRAAATSDIEAGDFAQAQQKLERAALAMRRFSGHTRESREINQLAAEVSCIVDLLDRPLEEVLRHRKSISADESERYFRDTLKNSVLLMDTHISPKPESEPGTYRVDSPLVFGPDTVWVDISKLKLFGTWSEAGPIRVLFAARIVTIDSGPAAGEWTVRLAPDSGVLITWSLCAERLGWPLDEPTRALLDSQSKRVIDLP
jgi:hypothetical protein